MAKSRLAAVLALDVVGFSQMAHRDPGQILVALNAIYRSVVRPAVLARDGRVVKLLGDGAIIEFSAAEPALACAIAVQTVMNGPQHYNPYPQRITLRAALHASDVVVNGDDIFGDAVNVASRLQANARPGGVLVTGTIRELVGGHLASRLRPEGPCRPKGMDRELEVYSVAFEPDRPALELVPA